MTRQGHPPVNIRDVYRDTMRRFPKTMALLADAEREDETMERAKIVAWLREQAADYHRQASDLFKRDNDTRTVGVLGDYARSLLRAADAIERGDHLTGDKQ